MSMAIVEVSVVPLGRPDTSLSDFIARAIAVLRESGLPYDLTAMGTIISGDLDEIMAVVRKMHECCFEAGAPRVLTTVKIDDRRDRRATPEQKVKSVQDKLPR
jgi:uncharacterized protein (TIGR00106 family)